MSSKGEVLYHPSNGSTEQTWNGFSWPAFLFGIFWLAVKGLWAHFIVMLGLCIISGGFLAPIIWIAYGCIGNGAHKTALFKRGYLTAGQWQAKSSAATPAPVVVSVPVAAGQQDLIAKLRGLKELLDAGALTQAEFETEKAKVLAAG
jgi:hypothetical protein